MLALYVNIINQDEWLSGKAVTGETPIRVEVYNATYMADVKIESSPTLKTTSNHRLYENRLSIQSVIKLTSLAASTVLQN